MRQLTAIEFQTLVLRAAARFAIDWSRQRAKEPGLFPEAQAAHLWWEAFSEFAQADILNPAPAEDPAKV